MNRRSFFGRLAAGLATAALAAHADFASLVPVLVEPAKEPIRWYYLVEVVDTKVVGGFPIQVAMQHVWLSEAELASHGLKPEDFLSLEPGQSLGPAKAYINGRNVEYPGELNVPTGFRVAAHPLFPHGRDMERDSVTTGVTDNRLLDWIEE